ncbi:hypothetical protein [Rhodoferax mekongensis]|uniref:hypothetical protein n=1 Tax=Rhodoferax mekongensis TaxID=3068341 RepID=UPI0028BF1E2F|nr:hypothetical protein [Rhodoferax sp. TBRC 17199]MDT7514375.1 hypothetical protein [Rhodoferax sp. TBRC 17199]
MTIRTRIFAATILALGLQAHAGVSVPNTFTSGQAASASAVNQNFTALATAIDSVSVRVSKLENSQNVNISDLLGTYNLMVIQTEVSTSNVALKQIVGSVVLSYARVNSSDVYSAAFSCTGRNEESVSPNASYGTGDPVDITPFNTSVNNSCTGVFAGGVIDWRFDTSSRKVTFTGSNIELMPLGPGLLIGRDLVTYTSSATNSTPLTVGQKNAVVIFVRKQ